MSVVCINADCKTELKEYDIIKIPTQHRASKYRFCYGCRSQRKVEFVNCLVCNNVMTLSGKTIVCRKCHDNYQKTRKQRWYKTKYNKTEKMYEKITKYIENQSRSVEDICEKFGMTPNGVFAFVHHMRNRNKDYKISTRYMAVKA